MKKLIFILSILFLPLPCFGIDTPREQLAKMKIPYAEDAFIQCIVANQPKIVHLFLESGMNPNIKAHNLLRFSGEYSYITTVYEGDPFEGQSPLLLALALNSMLNSKEIIQDLLNHGADVNIKDSKGRSILMIAVINNSAGIVQLLVDKGADVNFKAKNGNTALMYAVLQTDSNTLKILLKAGADINDKNNDGNTALMSALIMKHPDNANYLIHQGANVNLANLTGQTPLIGATYYDYLDVVKNLLVKSADCNAKTKDGWTALSIAKKKGFEEIVDVLIKAGAKE